MAIITKKEIKELSAVQDTSCVSIFIPTHRSGQAVLQHKDEIVLGNQLKEVTAKLEEKGLSINETKELLAPVEALLKDENFWRHQSDGLAIFLANGFFRKYALPVSFEAFNYVSGEFYLKPLMPMFTGDGRFFILALQPGDVNFYEGTRHSIAEVYIKDLSPSRLEEVVGFDYKQKSLQFRSQQEGHGQAAFHGHGGGKEERKDEILKYFRAINDGLMTMLHDETPPMVVACLDYLFPIYKKVNTYKHLMSEHISGNPADADWRLLQEKAWDIVFPYFDKVRKEKIALFKQFHETQRTSSEIEEIVPAALEGKIDALFLKNRSDIWGVYDPAKREVEIEEEHHIPNVSLMNLAGINVFLQQGKVYLLEEEEMPDALSKVNAVYRY